MLSSIRRWLGIEKLQNEVARLQTENAALREGRATILPDGKVAISEPPKFTVRTRARSWSALARQREADKWRELVHEAFPNAGK